MYEVAARALPRQLGEVGMTWRHIVLATGLALASTTVAAEDARIDAFKGDWHGTEVSASDQTVTLAPVDLDIRLQVQGSGFHMAWTGFERQADGRLARQAVDASFTPTNRPGVFAFDPGKPSLLSRLFADPATANPLKGETLLWARLEGPTLTVYSLAIDDHGGFDLDRYARTLTDHGMTVRYTHRVENDRILTVEGRLERAGG
jgi:hypothetical protein